MVVVVAGASKRIHNVRVSPAGTETPVVRCKPRSETVPNPPVEECTGEGRAVVTV